MTTAHNPQTFPEQPVELKLADGELVMWHGTSGEDVARRYLDVHGGATVVAWRLPRHGLSVGWLGLAGD